MKKSASGTHTGNVRSMNQDSFLVFRREQSDTMVVAVADGMGGHRAGNVASVLALDSVRAYLDANPDMDDITVLANACTFANTQVFDRAMADDDCYGMGTTLSMALLHDDGFVFAHVGDSRIYLFDTKGELTRVSHDHSLVQELVDCGRLKEEEAPYHPQRNIITRAVGTAPDVAADVETRSWEKGDLLLLCSDGLCGEVTDEVILRILRESDSPEDAKDRLIEQALQAGGTDNITVVLVQNEDEVNE